MELSRDARLGYTGAKVFDNPRHNGPAEIFTGSRAGQLPPINSIS